MSIDSLRKKAGLNWINLLIFLMILAACSQSPLDINENTPEPDQQEAQPYLGQEFPGSAVIRFAPSIFKDEMHAPPIFTPDGREVYWSMMGEPLGVRYMRIENGAWTEPTKAPFDRIGQGDSPFISADGTRLLFLSWSTSGQEAIRQVDREDGNWGTPHLLPDVVNDYGPHWQASLADNGNLYFGAEGNLYFSASENGNYVLAEIMELSRVLENGYDGSPFIAPDESYLIFDRGVDYSRSDLYITFRNADLEWSDPIPMDALNSDGNDLYANVSPDGRFLMFLSSRSGILLPYWVDANIIEEYRP
jgi:Tol biopolymer transport system component